mgnify:CR=1 FL=1
MKYKQCVNTERVGVAEMGKRTGENDSVSNPERVDDAVELASFAALEALPFVDDQAVPPRHATEDRSVSLQCLVRRKDDVRLERAIRFEHFEVLDDPARLRVALQSGRVSRCARARQSYLLAHIVRHDSQPGRPTGKFTQPYEDESVSIAQDTKWKAERLGTHSCRRANSGRRRGKVVRLVPRSEPTGSSGLDTSCPGPVKIKVARQRAARPGNSTV